MNRKKELQLAKAPYNWLKASPLLTIPTLFIIASIAASSDAFYYLCSGNFDCGNNGREAMEYGVGVLVSALWHLLLLQYVNNKESEIVRGHGRRALIQAGVRTGVAFIGIVLDWLSGAGGGFACIFVGILALIWVLNATQSKGWVEGDNPPVPVHPATPPDPEPEPEPLAQLTQPTQEMLDQVFQDLDSEDDVTVLTAIGKLGSFSESNAQIIKRLEELASEDDNRDIRIDARAALDQLKKVQASARAIGLDENMPAQGNDNPKEVLNELYSRLQSEDDIVILQAIAELTELNYSSAAIRQRLEKLAVNSTNPTVRTGALAALNTPAHRTVRQKTSSLTMDRGVRIAILKEIGEWESSGLLGKQSAEVIRRRYDFDIAPQSAPTPAPVQTAVPTPQAVQPKPALAESPAPVASTKPPVPPEPRPSLLQTLTSEASIKIYLYLGAFFVIAAAAILGAVVESLRLPILIISTLIFGSLSVAIKRRLPQPSFALFIVFSFLLPITANSVEETLRSALNLSTVFSNGYWTLVFFIMAVIWGGGTWLYESRLFSITTFGSLILSLIRLGDMLDAEPVIYTFFMELASFFGLAGTWLLKKWKDNKFATPLFISAQILHFINLGASLVIFGATTFEPASENLWNLVALVVWVLAVVFFIVSNKLYPFFAFPWLTAASIVPMPWFFAVVLDLESFGSAIVLFVWGAAAAASSDGFRRFEFTRKYGLPVLLASLPSLALALFTSFVYEIWLGLIIATVIAFILAILHILQSRWWLWALALLNMIIAYFTFFQLDFIARLDVYFGYQLTGIAILFLLPDLVMKKDWQDRPAWRLPPRIFGALFLVATSIMLFFPDQPAQAAIGFGILALFCAAYALLYRNPLLGYIPAVYLPLAVIYGLDALNTDAWLPALTGLAVIYYLSGAALRSRTGWGDVLRYNGLVLGVLTSISSLILFKETGGWYALIVGLLFIIETYLSRKGAFEVGAPILFTLGAFLILHDFKVLEFSKHIFTYSLIWIAMDTTLHLTFRHPRPWRSFMSITGMVLTVLGTVFVITDGVFSFAAIAFGIYTLLYLALSLIRRMPNLAYIPAAYLPLTAVYALEHFDVDAWLPVLTGIAILYFVGGLAIRAKDSWSLVSRNSALALGTLLSIIALITFKETGGWYALIAGSLFIAEMYLRKNGWFEVGAPALFTLGIFLILRDYDVVRTIHYLLAYSLIWLMEDLIAHLAFRNPRPLAWLIRLAGGISALINYGYLFFLSDSPAAAVNFAVYAPLFLTVSLVYRQPVLLYAFTVTLPLFATFLFRALGITQWIHPVIGVAVLYYAAGYLLHRRGTANGWDQPLHYSGLGLSIIVSGGALILGGLDASIPVAIAATLWAFEAFSKRNVWLAFPANGLYLLAYFIILFEMNVDEVQFFSIGTALFGLIQHYLLTRAESKSGTFLMGMFSQFVLLGTTYIEMINKNDLNYFFLLFVQSLVILVYGIVIRSRSLTFFPIGFVALGVVTVAYSALKDIGTIFLIGCTGILLLMLGVGAVLLRERITKLGEKLSDWKA